MDRLYGNAAESVPVIIAFDPDKDAANRAKHGVSLILGAAILRDKVGETVDRRRDCGKVRTNAFGLVAGRLFVCTYTVRGTSAA